MRKDEKNKKDFISVTEHQNFFGVDDNLGPVAISIKREKLDERGNNLGKSEAGLYQYRVILRTSEVSATIHVCTQ